MTIKAIFEIHRIDSRGNEKVSLAEDVEAAHRIFSIAGTIDPRPKILYNGKEITYQRLIELLKVYREKLEKERIKEEQRLMDIVEKEKKREESRVRRDLATRNRINRGLKHQRIKLERNRTR